MALVLAFDTSASACAAACLSDDTILATASEPMARGQAERLFPLLDDILARSGTRYSDLDAIAVGVGPGNFTGIRLGVAAARGLAMSLGRPAVGVSSLDATGYGLPRPILVSVMSRPGHAYIRRLDPDGDSAVFDGAIDSLPKDLIQPGLICAGYEAALIADQLGLDRVAPAAPPAEAIARLALAQLRAGTDIPPPAPVYVRPADAAPAKDRPPVLLDP